MIIELPFPPASLSGHNNGSWKGKSKTVQDHRTWAHLAALEAAISVPDEGDIHMRVTFIPPNNRGDRMNFPNRFKPYADGIADALAVNDKRFVPEYRFEAPQKPGRVIVEILP